MCLCYTDGPLQMATWRSGYAEVCKTLYPGSIPGVASITLKTSLALAGVSSGQQEQEHDEHARWVPPNTRRSRIPMRPA